MGNAGKSAADFSPEERRFLLQIHDAGVIAFNPREDDVIAHLLDMGLIDAERVEDGTALLRERWTVTRLPPGCATI